MQIRIQLSEVRPEIVYFDKIPGDVFMVFGPHIEKQDCA